MQHALILEDHRHNVALSRASKGYRLHWDGQEWPCAIHPNADGSYKVRLNGQDVTMHIAQRGDDVYVHVNGLTRHLRYRQPLDLLAEEQQGTSNDNLRAPMPGSLIALHTSPGAAVAQGETLLIIESMKMETSILAPRDGVVEAVHAGVGDTFDHDALLLTLVSSPTSQDAQP